MSRCHKVPCLPRETRFKSYTFAALPIGIAIATSHGHLRTVANGCERLCCATSSEHILNPQTPRVKREPLLRIREKVQHIPSLILLPSASGLVPGQQQCTALRSLCSASAATEMGTLCGSWALAVGAESWHGGSGKWQAVPAVLISKKMHRPIHACVISCVQLKRLAMQSTTKPSWKSKELDTENERTNTIQNQEKDRKGVLLKAAGTPT